MKKLTFALAALLFILSFASCAGVTDKGDATSASATDVTEDSGTPVLSEVISLFENGTSDYTLVRPDVPEAWETEGAVEFNNRFDKLTGTKLKIITDWEKNGKNEKEVIIGKTNREGTDFEIDRALLGRGGYIVTVKGERLVIAAYDKAGMTAALDWFFALFAQSGTEKLAELTVNRKTEQIFLKNTVKKLEGTKLNYVNVKAMWLSQYDLQNVYGDESQRSKDSFRTLIGKMLDNAAGIGINTVIVQVRPNADSMYPSEFYAPSSYVVGKYGNNFSYDPFEIITEEAHKREISVHAWINPMRAMLATEIESLDSNYQLKKWWNDTSLRADYLPVVSSRVYLNVGYPEVRKLITDGADELMRKYDVDGLHMDDYFYPTQSESFDAKSYRTLGAGKSLADWRRNNINTLVADLYKATKAVNRDILFGISPAGTMEKDIDELYADVKLWCGTEGYIDYICPQIYFGLEHKTQAFDMNAEKWSGIIKTDKIGLWFGMTLGKAVNGSKGTQDQWAGSDAGKNEWIKNKDILKRCLEYTENVSNCDGVAYFCYQYFWNPVSGAENTYTAAERANFLPLLLKIEWN